MSGFNWGNALITAGSGLLNFYSNYQTARAGDKQFDRKLDYEREKDALSLEMQKQALAQQLEIAGMQAKTARKQMIQQAYAKLVDSALTGGGRQASAMGNIGTMAQRGILGGTPRV